MVGSMLDTFVQDLGKNLRSEFEAAAKSLEATGLSSYEAKAYVGLVAMGFGTADEIADLARIPRTSSYKVLKALEDKGFASSTDGRPIVYRPEDPAVVYGRIKEGLDETFAKLELLHEVVRLRNRELFLITIVLICLGTAAITGRGLRFLHTRLTTRTSAMMTPAMANRSG